MDAKIAAAGTKVRELKASKAPKEEVSAAVKVLLDLKAQGGVATGCVHYAVCTARMQYT